MSEDLSKRIESLLLAYRTRWWVDGAGDGMSLVTAFNPPSDLSQGSGKAEVSELADYLAGELEKADDARDARRWRALMQAGVTYYDPRVSAAPALACCAKRIWYHATDDTDHRSLAETMDAFPAALASLTPTEPTK